MKFEAPRGFLPDTQHIYSYQPDETFVLGPFEFIYANGVMDLDVAVQQRPDSDGAHVVAFLRQNGFRRSGGTMNERYVYLPDQEKRNELMIIYSEPLAKTGFQVADFEPGQPGDAQWPTLASQLHKRAMASFTVLPAAP